MLADGSIIATPGRLLHVVVEMRYSMADMDTVIYDEADRYVLVEAC
jgi:superfamily II DNA/RNA helicase